MLSPKITRVETSLVGGGRWGWVIVRVHTDEGVCGIGEGSLEGREQSVATAVNELGRYLIGKNSSEIEKHYFALYRDAIWTGGAVLQSAISAVEMALWDIKGKVLGAPVYELLGGKVRDRLELYANGWWYKGGTPEEVGVAARRAVDIGYRGVKFNPFNRQPGVDPYRLNAEVVTRGIDYVAAVRDAVGPDIDIYLDYNAVFNSVSAAIRATKALETYNIAFVEEPLPQENMGELAYFRRKVNVAVATGERLFSPFTFRELLHLGAADVIQPDLSHCGGLLAGRKIAALGEMHYVPLAPHNPNGPIGESATIQLAMCIPNFLVLEHFRPESWRAEVVRTSYTIDRGWLTVSDEPGLGVEIDESAAAMHPFEVRDLIGFHEPTFVSPRQSAQEE